MKRFLSIGLAMALLVTGVVGGLACVVEEGAPAIGYSLDVFEFTAMEGYNPPDQILRIWNAGTGTLNWSASDDADWLILGRTSGSSKGETDDVEVKVDVDGFVAGEYTATITITADGAVNSSAEITVTLTVMRAESDDGLYTATTEDGVELKLRRYRPSPDADFNTGQPVLLMPGILCNVNEFLPWTPPSRERDYADMELPTPIADWAEGDPYIEADPLLYYNLGHYLWLKGYDPWFGNFRGVGYGAFKSNVGGPSANLDIWAIYDTPALIDKVQTVTGKWPVIGGHSTGGLVCYIYLQGCEFEGTRVVSNSDLVAKRNENIPAFVAIDPASIPPYHWVFDQILTWGLLDKPLYVDLRSVVDIIEPTLAGDAAFLTLKTLYPILWDVGVFLAPYSELISWFLFLNSDDMDEYVQDFVVRYAIPCSLYTHCFAQYLDFLVHQTNREFWKNDPSHATDVVAPEPYPGDGYYYYLENMENVSIPTIAVLSEFDSLVVADEIIEHLMEGKTPDASDEYYIIPDTAHIDIVMGLKAPTITFPFIGDWLDKICQ